MVELIHTHKGTVYAQRNGVLIPVNTDGLVGYWPMTEGSGGTAYDESKNGNTGTINGASWTSTANGKALDFDGTDDYVDCPDSSSLEIRGNITISAWIKTSYTASYQYPVAKDDASGREWLLQVAIYADAGIRFGIFDPTAGWTTSDYGGVVNDGQWHHVLGMNNGTTIAIYVDDVLENSSSGGSIRDEAINLQIGRRGDGSFYLNGLINEVRVYNRALSSQEITNIYEKTRGLYGV